MVDLKQTVRIESLKKRDSIPLPVRRAKDAAIRERLLALPEFRNAGSILFYASFRSEVGTEALIKDALGSGKRVLLPRVEGERLALHEIGDIGELTAGYMGIPEPPAGDEAGIDGVDIALIPGAAFDIGGSRLGYGKGYYDKLLSGHVGFPLVALAYEEQIVESIIGEGHDVSVDMIITDRRGIDCREQKED